MGKPVKWGCFELDNDRNFNYLTSPYVPGALNFNWQSTSWPHSKKIIALNRNQAFTAYFKKVQTIYQIPLNESFAGRKVLQVLQLKSFEDDVIWTSVQQRANTFILENSSDSIEQWISKYPPDKPTIAFPEIFERESSLSAHRLFEHLQVKKCDLVMEPQTNKLPNGHMEIWYDNRRKLHYRVGLLGQES